MSITATLNGGSDSFYSDMGLQWASGHMLRGGAEFSLLLNPSGIAGRRGSPLDLLCREALPRMLPTSHLLKLKLGTRTLKKKTGFFVF